MTDKEQIICKYKFQDKEIFDGKPYCTCFSELCEDLPPCDDNCQIYEDYKQLTRKTKEYDNLSDLLRATDTYSEVCNACKDDLLIYPSISGRTSYTDNEVDAITLKRIIDVLKNKTQELDKYKQSLDEKNKFLQDLGISAGGEFKRIKFYIENFKNKYNEKAEECEELISEKDFYLQKIAVLEQEFEQLEEKYEALKLENEEGYEIVDELKHECEELKGEIEASEKINRRNNQELLRRLTYASNAEKQRDRYRKALEEIDKVINNIFDRCLGHKTDGCTPVHNVCEELIKILDIINKAKGEIHG